ncbi:hypothetical protein [Sporosarcina sp. NPDC096371]|uniref:hypothetical protein n=1 Tax=Sporosarcina sp. NPDC096371 TaxID=3364530 RepID=UPI003828B256
MKNSKFTVISILLLVCVLLLAINLFKKDLWDTNLELLKGKVLAEKVVDGEVDLTTFTQFEWDEVYSFTPFVSKEVIYETIGYQWDDISETVSEGMNQIVFVKDGKVVCYIYGYPDNNQFGLYFEGANHNNVATILYAADHPIFDVTKSGEVVYLRHMK